jgi:hypothetical protein
MEPRSEDRQWWFESVARWNWLGDLSLEAATSKVGARSSKSYLAG